MRAESSVKQEHIVEAAIKRFTHFGINKTTMAEIASDLGISKPTLFYYFNDKNSLQEAVGKKIVNEFLLALQEVLNKANTIEDGLIDFIEVKRDYIKKYSLLALQVQHFDTNKPIAMLELAQEAHKRAGLLLANFLQKGIDKGSVKPHDTASTSHLILETLAAFDLCFSRRSSMVENNDVDELFNKQREVVKMLVNGLKN
ncbi:TetR/AcrR family transcriptional regulator [Aridibaculum aurantiacum]|uniref:TetR/AcrR family transcriptional regulator n=1 Tax=Aridibaculum aurantiacum TaxID=2810307 RepID=UPI001A9697FD|nr:TetR/AcrR family transcriptional regulator [Aridibaculum aurantiacum]